MRNLAWIALTLAAGLLLWERVEARFYPVDKQIKALKAKTALEIWELEKKDQEYYYFRVRNLEEAGDSIPYKDLAAARHDFTEAEIATKQAELAYKLLTLE